ncbi:arsenate reductase ArsC [Nitrospira sp. CMX1]
MFLCTGNSARSQMAEGLLRHPAEDRYAVYSAGTHPVGLNPGAVMAMQELNLDISAQQSKHMDAFTDQAFDYVITVCDRAKESCPHWLHTWSFEDPAAVLEPDEERRTVFRTVRDQIKTRIEKFFSIGR